MLAIGLDPAALETLCAELRPVGRLTTLHDDDNDETGTALSLCVPRQPWAEVWSSLRHVG